MPKKKAFEEEPYDPFAAEGRRAAIKAATGSDGAKSDAPSSGGVSRTSKPRPAEPGRAAVPKPRAVGQPAKVRQGGVEAPKDEPKAERPLELKKLSGADARKVAASLARQSVQKRFRVTPEEELEFEAFIVRLRTACSSKVDFSVVSRALWTIVQHAESQLMAELKRTDVPQRPGKQDALGLAEYEEQWVRLMTRALRSMPPAK